MKTKFVFLSLLAAALSYPLLSQRTAAPLVSSGAPKQVGPGEYAGEIRVNSSAERSRGNSDPENAYVLPCFSGSSILAIFLICDHLR